MSQKYSVAVEQCSMARSSTLTLKIIKVIIKYCPDIILTQNGVLGLFYFNQNRRGTFKYAITNKKEYSTVELSDVNASTRSVV